ncbi:sugar O-acetyltransferase [Hoylesella nanceiensis]|jgi:galactoside O-acetyltransferase|uniref:sugar O-acetyltransferase n=1 Tax=Hoylesella nanceiensis TaxID=425941 RepID=UPI001CB58A8C|nr:sugar O-acetyltransferase [Hoylesella nanceiensis]MBF1421096.1 sugar O-acetyltransferase [Hoylesella nanceiensis]MBF1429689.1 sugar O-acetyltransferase [Hoylesella nanceiensis]
MKEMNKMRASLLYDFSKEEIVESFKHAKELCVQLQNLTVYSNDYRKVISQLIPGIPNSSVVTPPFNCDHGHGIVLGENVFINCNCVFLDGGEIRVGKNTLIGPACQLYTNQHPTDYLERRKPQEVCLPITIGEDTWIGGSVVILPGVTIGDRCIIAAGSLVMHDIPNDCVVAGSPAVIKRKLNKE